LNALSTTETDIYDEIDALRRREDATILAHYYQDGEIQELADYTGDSLKLARLATRVESPTIVFCGVHFMAETAKMLNPDKRVLLPDLRFGRIDRRFRGSSSGLDAL
jgi:quinolinate synthase